MNNFTRLLSELDKEFVVKCSQIGTLESAYKNQVVTIRERDEQIALLISNEKRQLEDIVAMQKNLEKYERKIQALEQPSFVVVPKDHVVVPRFDCNQQAANDALTKENLELYEVIRVLEGRLDKAQRALNGDL